MRHAGVVILLVAATASLAAVHPWGNPRVEPKGLGTLLSSLHWNAQLSAAEVGEVASGDAVRGKAVFARRCTGCHAMDGDREGPRLAGVFGRKAGSVPGFEYSPGLKNSGIVWDAATLERWLRGPDAMVPDTKMDFYVPNAQERADLIAYLR